METQITVTVTLDEDERYAAMSAGIKRRVKSITYVAGAEYALLYSDKDFDGKLVSSISAIKGDVDDLPDSVYNAIANVLNASPRD